MSNETREDARADMQTIREDLKQLQSDLKKVSGDLYGAGRASLETAGKSVKENADAAAKYVRQSVNEHPVTSLLVAAGVGLIVGSFLSRRR
ncbi:MAG: DUF883 family protein [Phycisphaerales bacterium]